MSDLQKNQKKEFMINNRLAELIAEAFPKVDLGFKSEPPSAVKSKTALSFAETGKPTVSTATVGNTPLTFEEAISRLRMVMATIPKEKLRGLIPILSERMKTRVLPEDRDAFETVAMSFIPDENDETDNMLKRMLPLMLIMSLLRRE